jgi:hypothetical protein
MRQTKYEYDAFISHAVEDKIPIANELCARLEQAGLKIWYSGKELGVGDSIEKTIERGLNRSRYGIVILSPTYLAKNWTIREFYTLLAKEIDEHKVILPVLYNIGLDDLRKKDLLMADRFAVHADRGLDFVADKLVGEIQKQKAVKQKVAWFSRIWLLLVLSLLANIFFLLRGDFLASKNPMLVTADQVALGTMSSFGGESVFTQMECVANEVAPCNCGAAKRLRPLVRQASLRGGLPPLDAEDGAEHTHAKRGGRMTMAVVFQFETAPQPANGADMGVDDMLQIINPRPAESQFITMSSNEAVHSGGFRRCSHGDVHSD